MSLAPSPHHPTTPTHCSRNLSSGGGGAVGGQQNDTREQSGSAAGWNEAPARTQGSVSRPQSAPAISAGGDHRSWTRRPPQDERRRTSQGSTIDGRDRRGDADARQRPHGSVADGRHRRGEAASAGGARQGARESGGGQPGGSRKIGGTVSHAPTPGNGIQPRAMQCLVVSHRRLLVLISRVV